MSKMFLSVGEIGELTGVRTGSAGKTLQQRQIEALQEMRVPHYVNPLDRVMVPRASVEHGIKTPEQAPARRGLDLSKVR